MECAECAHLYFTLEMHVIGCTITTHPRSHVITGACHYSRNEEVHFKAESYLRRALALNSALLCMGNGVHRDILIELREVSMHDHILVLVYFWYIIGSQSQYIHTIIIWTVDAMRHHMCMTRGIHKQMCQSVLNGSLCVLFSIHHSFEKTCISRVAQVMGYLGKALEPELQLQLSRASIS